MKTILMIAALAAVSFTSKNPDPMSIYDFKVEALDGSEIDLNDFKGKKILIVNTASKCGYTKQYAQLEDLHQNKKDELVVIGFPANNFGGQEPGSNADIAEFCQKNFGVSFPMAAKVSVKGADQHALFKMLTSTENPDFKGDINWNFEKFLIDEKGKLIRRYRSGVDPVGEEILGSL
ncbi:MAG: glutathione peroxidase [Cryomorphaceae bacterium]